MKKIRNGIFETNSSSTHSITLGDFVPTKNMTGWLPDEDGNYHIAYGEFGWGPDEYNDCMTKASYALTFAKDDEHKDELLKSALADVGIAPVVFDGDAYNAYIDHQSSHVGALLFESKENLLRFIFDSDSVLTIDNDNH